MTSRKPILHLRGADSFRGKPNVRAETNWTIR